MSIILFPGLIQRHPTPRKSSSVPFFARIALSTFQGPLSVLFMKSKKNSKMDSKKDSKKISVLTSIRGKILSKIFTNPIFQKTKSKVFSMPWTNWIQNQIKLLLLHVDHWLMLMTIVPILSSIAHFHDREWPGIKMQSNFMSVFLFIRTNWKWHKTYSFQIACDWLLNHCWNLLQSHSATFWYCSYTPIHIWANIKIILNLQYRNY